jgi:hypothetical protein
MADAVLTPSGGLFPAGTLVTVHRPWEKVLGRAPSGTPVATGLVTDNGVLTFTGLIAATSYTAYAVTDGEHRYIDFMTDAPVEESESVDLTQVNADLEALGTRVDTLEQEGVTLPDASTSVKGSAKLSVAPAAADNPIAAGDNDPRLTNARTPTAHTHPVADLGSGTPQAGYYLDGGGAWTELGASDAMAEVFEAKSTSMSLRSAVEAANANGGGLVLAQGAPSYSLGSGDPLEVGEDFHIHGTGATVITQDNNANLAALFRTTGFDGLRGTDSGAGARRFGLKGLILHGNAAQNSGVATDGIQIFGYHYDVSEMRVFDMRGRGYHAEHGTNGGTYMPVGSEPGALGGLRTPMEAHWDNIRAAGCRKAGFYLSGPNDSTVRRLFLAYNANASYGVPTEAQAWFGPNSLAVLLDTAHVWSGGYEGYRFDSSINASNLHAEGSYGPALGLYATSIQIIGGRIFFGAGWANSSFIGLKWGAGAFSSRISGVSVEGCVNGAFDFTASTSGASRIQAYIIQSSGLLYTGTPSEQVDWDLSGAFGPTNDHPSLYLPVAAKRYLPTNRRAAGSVGLEDDFLSGTVASALGWTQVVNAGTIAAVASLNNHPGILRLSTGATSGQSAGMILGSSGILTGNKEHEHYFVFRVNQTTATQVRIGIGSGVIDPANGVYLEHLAGDTNWFFVTRAAGVETRVDTGVAFSTSWVRARMRWRFSGTTIWTLNLNESADIHNSGNVPSSSTALSPFVDIEAAAAADKTLDLDYYNARTYNLTRA